MIIKAFAKINWHLAVLGQRDDGYHALDMVMQHVDLFDLLDIEPANALHLSVQGDLSLQADESNLVLRAARALQKASCGQLGARIMLQKAIPSGAGLGGGSADAAAALYGLNEMWGLGYTQKELQAIGLNIGADVPYCLEARPAYVHGIGERIKPFRLDSIFHLVIVKPQESLSTKDVFAAFRSRDAVRRRPIAQEVIAALSSGSISLLKNSAINDLQQPAIALLPAIKRAIDGLYALGAGFAQMSGSGSAVFGVFQNSDEAAYACCRIKDSYAFCQACSTLGS